MARTLSEAASAEMHHGVRRRDGVRPISAMTQPPTEVPRRRPCRLKRTRLPPGPLPPCPEVFPTGGDLWRAFQVCKTLESKEKWISSGSDLAHTRSEGIPLDLTPTCAARVLGFALLYSPSDHGRDALAAEILECSDSENDHELLSELAHIYVYGLIRLCTLLVTSRLSFC